MNKVLLAVGLNSTETDKSLNTFLHPVPTLSCNKKRLHLWMLGPVPLSCVYFFLLQLCRLLIPLFLDPSSFLTSFRATFHTCPLSLPLCLSPDIYSVSSLGPHPFFSLSVCMCVSPLFSLFACGCVSSTMEQLKVTGPEREEGRGRTWHSVAWGHTTTHRETERERDGKGNGRAETTK